MGSSKCSNPDNEKGFKGKNFRKWQWKHAVCDNRKQACLGDSLKGLVAVYRHHATSLDITQLMTLPLRGTTSERTDLRTVSELPLGHSHRLVFAYY